MSMFWIARCVILWAVVLFLGFLLLGILRSLALLSWRLERLEVTTPKPLDATASRRARGRRHARIG
jgi:hypothetical protein